MPKPTWEVAITVEAEHVLTIGSDHLAGVENIDDYADTILTCAQHLVSFIGGETEREKFFREEQDRSARNRDMWKGQCERQAEQLTAMRDLLREAQTALEPFAKVAEMTAFAGATSLDEVELSGELLPDNLRRARTTLSKIKKELPDAE